MNEAYIPATDGGFDLYYLFSILEYDYIPIVFIAKDANGVLYLCDCVECRGDQQWTIAKTSIKTIRKVLNKELSVYDALKEYGDDIIVVTFGCESESFTQKKVRFDDLTEEDLPDKDSFITCPERDTWTKFNEYLKESEETMFFTLTQAIQDDAWWNRVSYSYAEVLSRYLNFQISTYEKHQIDHGKDIVEKSIGYRFIDIATETKVSSNDFAGNSDLTFYSDRPDSLIAA